MASSSEPMDYERKRLENIRRNDEVMASLKLHSIAAELSASTKRLRDEAKSSRVGSQKKPKSDQTSTVIRRSLRSRGMPPDPPKNPRYISTLMVKVSPWTLGPISMEDAFREDGSDRTLIETIKRIGKESEANDSLRAKTAGGMVCNGENLSDSVKKDDCEVGGSFDLCSKSNSENVKEELSGNGVCKGENLSVSVEKEDSEVGSSFDVRSVTLNAKSVEVTLDGVRTSKGENLSDLVKKEDDEVEGSFNLCSMTLKPENVARILPDKIVHARFFPCSSSRILVVGNKLGDVGFWNLDHQRDDEENDDGIYTYHSHSGPVSGISIHKHCLSKVFTSCYDGFIRSMDAEKDVFDLIYSSENSIYSLSQRSNDAKCLYFGEESGRLNIWDERMGKCATRRDLHAHRINSIDFNSDNPNMMATSSSDADVFIWDLRSIDKNKPKALNVIRHKRAVYSAYFSPSGKCLVSSSFDDTVGIHSGINFEETTMIHHYNNKTDRYTFKAIWGWDDSYLFIGNMQRGVDVISTSQRRTIFSLQSPLVSAIPCRFDAHPYNMGMLAGATGGGQVYLWTLN